MKRLIVILCLFLSISVLAQLTPARVFRVANNTTAFSENLPKGSVIIDNTTGLKYLTILPVLSTKTIATCVLDVDLKLSDAIATETTRGEIPISTLIETLTGVDNTEVVTPQKLADDIRVNAVTYNEANQNLDMGIYGVSSLTGRIGTSTNNTTYEADGTMVMNGTATVWDDLNFAPSSSGGAAVTLPDYVTINNVIHREFTSANNQLCGDNNELPHKYKLGSLIYPHAHVFLKAGETAGTTGVSFTLYWELRQTTGTTSGSAVISATSAQLANGNKVDLHNGTFAGSAELGANLSLTIARTGGNAGDIVLMTYGVHYEIDTNGSRTATTK